MSRPTSRPPADSPLAEHIRRMVDDWPPLTDEQRAKLAALLAPPHRRAAPQAAA